MSTRFLLQTVLLLWIGQLALGGVGWLLAVWFPWAGLLVTLGLYWFICRVALVLRGELEAYHRSSGLRLHNVPLQVAVGAQLLSLLFLPYWAPVWLYTLLHGAVLPVAALLDRMAPGLQATLHPWLWLTALLQFGLFLWLARPVQRQRPVAQGETVQAAPGEWVAARRLADVEKRGLRVK